MSAFPSLPLFTDAYIADTAHLTCEEHGAYLRLLMFAWRSPGCHLPDDDARLARMLGLTTKRWAAIKGAVMAFWTNENGHWMQKRLSREHQFVSAKVEKKRASGLLGGRPKSLENKHTTEANGFGNGKQTESERKAPTPTPNNTPIVPTADEAARRRAESKPKHLDKFETFRSTYPKRSTSFPTTQAQKRWLQAMARGDDPDQIIAGAKAYCAEQARLGNVGGPYVKTADSWLCQQLWRDFIGSKGPPAAKTEPKANPYSEWTDSRWREAVRIWKGTVGHWPWRGSPAPDQKGTFVPQHILDEMGVRPWSQVLAESHPSVLQFPLSFRESAA